MTKKFLISLVLTFPMLGQAAERGKAEWRSVRTSNLTCCSLSGCSLLNKGMQIKIAASPGTPTKLSISEGTKASRKFLIPDDLVVGSEDSFSMQLISETEGFNLLMEGKDLADVLRYSNQAELAKKARKPKDVELAGTLNLARNKYSLHCTGTLK